MEDFVPYELALKLKEKGFRKPCIATYDKNGMFGYNYVQPTNIRAVGFDECLVYSNDCVMAPTISQVIKWLKKEKQIVFGIGPMQETDCNYLGWCITIYTVDDNGYGLSWKEELYYDSDESAALAGIKYAINNLI